MIIMVGVLKELTQILPVMMRMRQPKYIKTFLLELNVWWLISPDEISWLFGPGKVVGAWLYAR